ncbi:heterokaryon incompatibility protein Het-C-domain-containing protein [Crucibulum laeve]|uniref:Heterokaryon incompatibility protein Het-C-domain-containing protein n=1 Tax=Crucibulum laeve TaxID=68775 RepID=A0A5C3LYU8_9AGAR|nr:heterokaryon incompatibility protein Het-C-domain-containing protein [Crucibulum laeve]
MPSNIALLLFLVFIFAFCLSGNGVYAFGAGNIPSFAYMEGRAFRHGDIEDVLADLIKKGAGGGFALASILSKGHKFNGLDIKRVYFGNWLRDYSQAVDIASLKKLQLQTIINLCMALGFMAHGYATGEFEVTEDRLGVYLPTEHIDNPKGYGEGEDARKYHPKLRGPVDPRELEVDPQTGMKNYIANENGHWDTSKGLVRRTLEKCIHIGRQHRSNGRKEDEYEAYRLLGQSLHTLEDYSAHSNFCELALVSLGHKEVFVHVGDNVRIQAPNGKWVAPIVTGSFGSSDFIHSLLGEASDHLSSASVTDLNKELENARSKQQSERSGPGGAPSDPGDVLRSLFFTLPGGSGSEMSRDMEAVDRIRAGTATGGKRPEDMSPQELHAVLWQVLTFRDSVVKKISKTIEKIPGLGPLIEKLMDSISVFVFTTLEPFLKPILKTATSGLQTVSGEVIDSHDQYEVFNDPRASDPTHSFLSKDHFNLILNEPAGQLARLVVVHTVNLVIKAWDDNSVNVHQTTEEILQCLFHPDFHNSNSKIQREMLQCMRDWIQKAPNQHKILQRLSKAAVRNHDNIRLAGEGGPPAAQGSFAENQAHQFQHQLQGYAQNVPGFQQAQQIFGGSNFPARDASSGGGPGGPGYSAPNSTSAPPMTGQAAAYYGGGDNKPPAQGYQQQQHGGSSYGPPSGPPPGSSPYAAPSGPPPGSSPYATPSGPPPSAQHAGYSPSYTSPPPSFPGGNSGPSFPGSGPPSNLSFPGASPGFPGAPDHGHGGGYGHGPGPGGFGGPGGGPGGYGPPSGPPPGFPGGGGPGFSAPGGPPPGFPSPQMQFPGGQQQQHGQHHHQGGQSGYPGSNYHGGGW